jgi:type II secretory pathway component PulF
MKFIYQARTKSGEVKTGALQAASMQAATEILQRDDLFITYLKKSERNFMKNSVFLKGFPGKTSRFFRASWR